MNILIVDDDRATLEFMADAIENEGHYVRTAENGTLALKTYREFKPDLLLTDIQMPKKNGLELLKAIRVNDQHTKIIVTTAFGSEDYAQQALALGADAYIKKPVRINDLKEILLECNDSIRDNAKKKYITNLVHTRKLSISIENRMDRVTDVATMLVDEAYAYLDRNVHAGVSLGLNELISNAIEHGNLNISSEDKRRALARWPGGSMLSLYASRLKNPKLRNRQVHIDVFMSEEYCEWRIQDEGDGFDWKRVFENISNQDSNGLEERGIYLCRLRFDELTYEANGNIVRARKYAHTARV